MLFAKFQAFDNKTWPHLRFNVVEQGEDVEFEKEGYFLKLLDFQSLRQQVLSGQWKIVKTRTLIIL